MEALLDIWRELLGLAVLTGICLLCLSAARRCEINDHINLVNREKE